MLADLRGLVEVESHTHDSAALSRCADHLIGLGQRILGQTPNVHELGNRRHLLYRMGGGRARVAIVCHYDTVFPVGTLADFPFRVEGNLARGPGVYDEKGSIVMAFHVLAQMKQQRPEALENVVLFLNADEENASRDSRTVFSQLVREGLSHAIVCEGAGRDGELKVGRKGRVGVRVQLSGRGAHAGVSPDDGASVITQLANEVPLIQALRDDEQQTSVVVTTVQAGEAQNAIPARGSFTVDCRAWTLEELQRVEGAVRALKPVVDGVTRRTDTLLHPHPLGKQHAAELYGVFKAAAREVGQAEPGAMVVGGGSDASLLAALGVSVIDGVGPIGWDDHSHHEWIDVRSIVPRQQLLCRALQRLDAQLRREEPSQQMRRDFGIEALSIGQLTTQGSTGDQ
jgi:glutamate carboxypeptidase